MHVLGTGRVELGDDVRLDGRLAPIELRASGNAVVRLGAGCVVHGGASLEAEARVELGPRCVLHPWVKVMDNNFHPVNGDRLRRPISKPVTLGAGVVVGPRCIVLPGAVLEDGVVLGPGVVIGRRVRAGVTLAGSPPRAIPSGAPLPVFDESGQRQSDPGERHSMSGALEVLRVMARDQLTERFPQAERALRLFDLARAGVVLRRCELGSRVVVRGRVDVQVEGRASIGSRSLFLGGPVSTSLRVRQGAELSLGEGCQVNYGVTFDASGSVRVGDRCMFGSYAQLIDDGRPIVLGHDVWVAHGARISPGVTIGNGAVIAAGAVVTTDVPAGMLAMGNPARVVSQALSGA